jgi:hypothetical protein
VKDGVHQRVSNAGPTKNGLDHHDALHQRDELRGE